LDQPIVFCPRGELVLFEIGVALQARDGAIDSLIGKKCFRAWRKPRDRRAFGSKSFERGETSHRFLGLTLERGGLGYLPFGTVDFFLSVGDLAQGGGADFLQRPEEECEINVE